MEEVKKQPKAFVSYSWQPDENKEKVKNIVDRLRDHGIDAILDVNKLNVGHDKNAYMERMVTDDTIDKVLVFSNKNYAGKANEKKGVVGTESIIISKEVYESVTQDKFIPILMERDEDGKECFPVFINSRISLPLLVFRKVCIAQIVNTSNIHANFSDHQQQNEIIIPNFSLHQAANPKFQMPSSHYSFCCW